MRNFLTKAFAFVICFVLCIASMTVNTFAYTRIDTERETSLMITFKTKEASFSNVKFKLYHVADVSAVADYTLTAEFTDCAITLQDATADAWQKNVETLTAYIEANNIASLAEQTTDADGVVTFSGLQTGLYLVVGETHRAETATYTPVSFLIQLPQLAPEVDTWDYEVEANVKYTVTPVELPQTGQLWWPVALALPGMALVVAGIRLLRKKECT